MWDDIIAYIWLQWLHISYYTIQELTSSFSTENFLVLKIWCWKTILFIKISCDLLNAFLNSGFKHVIREKKRKRSIELHEWRPMEKYTYIPLKREVMKNQENSLQFDLKPST